MKKQCWQDDLVGKGTYRGPEDLSSIPRTHLVEGGHQLTKLSSDLHAHALLHSPVNEQVKEK